MAQLLVLLNDFTSIFVTGSQADGHGAFISGSLVVEGDVQIKGTTTTISSSNTTFQDSILGLGITGSDAGTEEFNNLGDRGLIFARGANQTDALPGMWWDGSKFNFAKSLTSPSSGSFGTVTDRSTIRTGDVEAEKVVATSVEASSVTASLGLRVGSATNGYEFPSSDGSKSGQVLQTDGSGKLTFADQAAGNNQLLVKRIEVTENPSLTGKTQFVSLGGESPDIIYLDFENVDVTNSAYTPSGNDIHHLTIVLSNVKNVDFEKPEREFYLGIRGFNYNDYQKSNYNPNTGEGDGLAIRIIFANTALNNVKRRDGSNTTTQQFGNNTNQLPIYTVIKNIYNDFTTPETIEDFIFDDTDMWYTHDFQFTGGHASLDSRSSALFDRGYTDNSKIFCFKYTFINGVGNEPMELVTDYRNIELFSINDSRFSIY